MNKQIPILKNNYLNAVKKLLQDYGVEDRQVFLTDSGQIEVEDHVIDREVFNLQVTWSRPEIILRAYTVDAGYLVFMPTQKFYEEYRENDELATELELIYKKVQSQIDQLSTNYYEAVAALNDEKNLTERIPVYVQENLQATDSLKDIKSWRVKIIMGNSLKKEGPKVGEMDSVGYTHIGVNTGTVIPVARGDEHHQGYDLIHDLMDQGLIPQDTYHPIFFGGDYVAGFDAVALQALKTWRKLGGENIIIKNSSHSSASPFQLTIDDYIKAEGKIVINPGELLPLGQSLIKHLQTLSSKTTEFRKTQRGEKLVYVQALRLLNFYQDKIIQYPTTSFEEIKAQVLASEQLGGMTGLQKLEEAIFGFNGLKNQLHQEVRKALDPKAFSFQRDNMLAIFGDLDLANHELGSI